jgi:hypothetical protein
MTSSEATGRLQSSCGHPGVVGDGATRLVEPDPRLPGKPRCGQRRGERRSGRPIARAKARLANPARTPSRYGGVGDLPPKHPRTTATASRRPVIYTSGGPLHECAGGVMHAGPFRSVSPFAEPPSEGCRRQAAPAQGCPIYPSGEDSLRVPMRDTRFPPTAVRHRTPDPASGTRLGEDTVLADETPVRTIESSPDAPGPYSGFPPR